MPIEAVKIPQNVYVEDRIVGPLTLRQLMIVALGGGGSYVLWSSLVKAYGSLDPVTTALAWTPAIIAIAFAFIRVNDLSLTRLVLLMLERMQKPSVRTWGPRTGISISIRTFTNEKRKDSSDPAFTLAKEQKLAELNSMLDIATAKKAELIVPATTQTAVATPAPAVPETEEDTAPKLPVDPSRVSVNLTGDVPPIDTIQPRSSLYSNSSHA